jgi:hypothetical protein
MKDDEVIAHQARKIAALEVKVARGVDCERQLLAILRRVGIEVTVMELNQEEAEFLRLYRSATPEGKAMIEAEVEARAKQADTNTARADNSDVVAPGQDVVQRKPLKLNSAKNEPAAAELQRLPNEFFKRPSE